MYTHVSTLCSANITLLCGESWECGCPAVRVDVILIRV